MNSEKKAKLNILYLVNIHSEVVEVNAKRRKAAWESAGATVTIFNYSGGFIKVILKLFFILKDHFDVLYIRIDGTGNLDKFFLLKVFLNLQLIWEVHGFPSEKLLHDKSFFNKEKVFFYNIKRYLFSYFVNFYVFTSEALKAYSRKNNLMVVNNNSYLINNFTNPNLEIESTAVQTILSQTKQFLVVWGGNGNYHWHDLELLEKVARKVYALDKSIMFILIGHNLSLRIGWRKNILLLPHMSYSQYMGLVSEADIGIALYSSLSEFPFYFSPMKIIDYLMLNKPVIVSSNVSVLRNKVDPFIEVDSEVSSVASKIVDIYKDSTLRTKKICSINRYIEKHCSFENAVLIYKDLLKQISSKI